MSVSPNSRAIPVLTGRAAKLKNRVRVYKPKVVTGCVTCKARHIKCDEGKPSCQQCLGTGRICEGYVSVRKSTTRPSPLATTAYTPTSISVSPSVIIPGTEQERHSLEFFRIVTIPQLCGLFGSRFWQRTILSTSYYEPAIKHAAIALAALHESLNYDDEETALEDDSSFAMQQYCKAISILVQPEMRKTADVALMCCVVFVCFEALRGKLGAAISHIDGGVKIISDLQQNSNSPTKMSLSTSPYVPLATINMIFVRMDTQVAQISHTHTRRLLSQDLDDKESGYQANIPQRFDSLEEARNSLDYIWTAYLRVFLHEPVAFLKLSKDQRNFTSDLVVAYSGVRVSMWASALAAHIRHAQETGQLVDMRAVHTLKIHYIITRIFLNTNHAEVRLDETLWDVWAPEFQAMLDHAEAVVRSIDRNQKYIFSLDGGVNMPLFFIAGKCRISKIRKKAIALLNQASKHEGVLNSKLAGRVAQRVVELEEQGQEGDLSCEDVPNRARVLGVEMKFDQTEKKATVAFRMWSKTKLYQKETVHEEIIW